MNRTPALENNITEIMPVGRPRAIVSSRNVAYVATGVALMTVCAWISIPVGDVPFTLQTFAVSVIGMLLGWKRGFAAVAIYILAGLVGIPVFAGFRAGVQAIAGPTGGYIFGFLFAVTVSGLCKLLPLKNKNVRITAAFAGMLLGLIVCYSFGTLWFLGVYAKKTGVEIGLSAALMTCVVPYIVPDLVKTALAAVISVRLEDKIS